MPSATFSESISIQRQPASLVSSRSIGAEPRTNSDWLLFTSAATACSAEFGGAMRGLEFMMLNTDFTVATELNQTHWLSRNPALKESKGQTCRAGQQ